MTLVNTQSDLVTTIQDQGARLTKVERQLVVPRVARSFVATKEVTTSTTPVALTTADRVVLTTTTATLINFFVRATVENSNSLFANFIYIRDETAAVNYQVATVSGTGPFVMATTPGSTSGVAQTSGAPLAGAVSLYVTTARPSVFSLRFASSSASSTASFSNRLLLAWAQPF